MDISNNAGALCWRHWIGAECLPVTPNGGLDDPEPKIDDAGGQSLRAHQSAS